MKINRKKVDEAILEIIALKIKYARVETMFISHRLDKALKDIGWDYSELLGGGSPKGRK